MYAGQDWPKKAVPTNGIFESSGISTTPARCTTGLSSESRKAVSPTTSTLRVRPTTNWLAVRRWLMLAWTAASTSPATAA